MVLIIYEKMTKVRKIVLVIIIVLFLLFVVPLINCEVLTILYGEELFSEAYSDNYMSMENG